MDNNVFTVKNLSFAYGKQQVLKNLDLELHEGKIKLNRVLLPQPLAPMRVVIFPS